MTINKLLEEEAYKEEDTIEEAKHTEGNEYPRYWHEYTKEEKEKNPSLKGHGIWIYKHREAMGVDANEKMVVHHIDGDKNNFDPENLALVSRSEHCKIDPNARKHFGCKVKGCTNPHYQHGYCLKHFMQKYRSGEFGHYDPKKNESKKNR